MALAQGVYQGIKGKPTMTDTAGGADPLVVADAEAEGGETVPVSVAEMVPTPCQKRFIQMVDFLFGTIDTDNFRDWGRISGRRG
jgi:hypothetical protein